MPTTTDPVIEPHRWYGVAVVARLLSMSQRAVRVRIAAGILPAARLDSPKGKSPWRVKGDDILLVLGKLELARGGSGKVSQPAPRLTPERRAVEELAELERVKREKYPGYKPAKRKSR